MTFDTAFERSHPPNTTTNEKDANVIHKLFTEFHYADDLGVIKSKLVEYVTTARKEARAAAFKEAIKAVPECSGKFLTAGSFREGVIEAIEAAANDEEGAGDG